MILFGAPYSSSLAANIALREAGVDFEYRRVILGGDKPELCAVNPDGKVPTLVLETGEVLTEVAAVLFFIAHAYPESRLIPESLEGQAQAISWMSFVASSLHAARALGEEAQIDGYGRADRRLRAGPWALGETYSVADIHLFRLYWRFGSKLPASFPNLAAHHDRMMQRDAVKAALAFETALVEA